MGDVTAGGDADEHGRAEADPEQVARLDRRPGGPHRVAEGLERTWFGGQPAPGRSGQRERLQQLCRLPERIEPNRLQGSSHRTAGADGDPVEASSSATSRAS